jgi:D-alanyl-D-alanine carboxypeptidase
MGFNTRRSRWVGAVVALLTFAAGVAKATPLLVIDARTGDVLLEQESTRPWYPASLTKLVTVYTALKAVRDGRITMDTPLVVSNRAARMPPSKMGFKPGTEVTLDNALKMMMVKSANDLAITVAEGVAGSVEDFAVQMNGVAASLGMRESHFVNPNGLHDPNHYSSARDLAIVAQALYRDFPDHADLYGIGAVQLGSMVIPTHNGIMGRYPGAEGMKTGFTCPAGFNVVVSATQGGRRLIAVVLGYPNAKLRTLKAASILDAAFSGRSTGVNVNALPQVGGAPPNMRQAVCGPHRQTVAEDDFPVATDPSQANPGGGQFFSFFSGTQTQHVNGLATTQAMMSERPYFPPIPVYLGPAPGYTGRVAAARDDTPVVSKGRTQPVTASAYAGKSDDTGASPLKADPDALPLRRPAGRHAVAARSKHARTAARQAEPTTDEAKAKPEAKTKATPKVAAVAKHKPAAKASPVRAAKAKPKAAAAGDQ